MKKYDSGLHRSDIERGIIEQRQVDPPANVATSIESGR